MDYLQETNTTSAVKFKSRLLSIFMFLNFIAVLVTFTLNFLGLPILKYHYLIHIGITFLAIILFDFVDILPIILTLYFFEGQGRILWEYDNWARIIFDSLVFLSIMKIFITRKKVVDLVAIPAPLIFLIAAHFLWYIVEFANLHSLSYFAVLAASKLYIYPLLFFAGLVQIDFDIRNKKFQNTLNFFMFLIFLELILTFYQFDLKESLLLQITPYYRKALKEAIFAGIYYRPFATTQTPGTISIFLFLTLGLLYLKNTSKLQFIIKTVLIAASGYAIILCQVRSAYIKFILIIIAIHLGQLLYSRFKPRQIIGLMFTTIILYMGINYVTSVKATKNNEATTYARDRISSLADYDKIKDSRLNTDNFYKIASQKLYENPMGLGPGLTGSASNMIKEEMVDNHFLNYDMLWTYDNLLVGLIIDFGFGSIFYILMLIYIPAYFFRFLAIYYKDKNQDAYNILLICFISTLVIIIGNWGANGLTYNPESFAFWFFSAIGFSTIARNKIPKAALI
jgi:hypothetical protein